MRLSRVVTGLAIGTAIAACVVQSQPPSGPTTPTPSNRADGPGADEQAVPDGQYSCTIDDYPPFVCQVYTNPDGTQTLEKMSGSQRFRGVIAPTGDGFEFTGVFFCPQGSCTQDVRAEFQALDDGAFRGAMVGSDGSAPMQISLMYMPGGMGYGGVGGGYGGIGYGYGGVGYGYGAGSRR